MASRPLASLALALSVAACGSGGERRFPLREPLWTDTDTRAFSVPCARRPTKKEPEHIACAPEPYESALAWDGVDNSVFRPLAKLFAVDPPREARNVNALDEVPDSSWFTNRLGLHEISREALVLGACTAADALDGETAAPGAWVVDAGKSNGSTPGFRIKVGDKKYELKADGAAMPERASAASVIGATIYHDVGFNSSCEQVVYFDPSVLKLTPGLKVTDNAGVSKPFDAKALATVLAGANKRGKLVRMQASAWLPGYLLGPFRYERRRGDDPNDAIPHEDRRDLRGARVLAAWLGHVDAREQNSMDAWIASHGAPDSSPGYVRHYYLDTSDLFGTNWDWDAVNRRFGNSYLLDWGDIAADFVTLGIPTRPWERVQRTPGMETFGYFHWREFDPAGWKNEYPNPAFSRATERDNAWMARILSRFDRGDIEALVAQGRFTVPASAAFLTEILEWRLRMILERYLLRLSPIADVRVEAPSVLCATDLARRRRVRPDADFRYSAGWRGAGRAQEIPVEARAGGEICMTLPPAAADPSAPPDAASRYVVVTIADGAATYPLRVHLYDLGPTTGYRLVGLERREERGAP